MILVYVQREILKTKIVMLFDCINVPVFFNKIFLLILFLYCAIVLG